MNCLTQTVVLFSALSTDWWGKGGAGLHTYRPLWLAAGFGSSFLLAVRAVTLDLLSPLPAPFVVNAQDQQARTRLETVWSLSEIDKIGDGVFYICLLIYKRSRRLEMGFVALVLKRLRPGVATVSQKYFWDKRKFFLLQSISRQLFMHR